LSIGQVDNVPINNEREEVGCMKKLLGFFKDEEGVVLIEYGLIAVLIGVFCIVVLRALGVELNTLFREIVTTLQSR
jgi:Flp pilus assembly pilin Flp